VSERQIVRVLERTKGRGRCNGCSAPIDWYETVAGRKMPMEGGAVPVKSENNTETREVVLLFDAKDSHWANCPKAGNFKR
jgi:hypothetical protein